MKFEIAIELLEIEHERLLRDHYDTAPTESFVWNCDGCIRARDVKAELDALKKEVTPLTQYDVKAFSINAETGEATSEPRVERIDTDNPIFAGCRGPWDVEDAYNVFWNRLNDPWEYEWPRGKEKVVIVSVTRA
jgi:hypothetical protein